MNGLLRSVLFTAVVLFGGGMTQALAGKPLSVSPGLLSQPIPGVTLGQAKSYRYQAVTRARVKKTGRVRAGGVAWQCQGKRCTITGSWPTPAVSACRTLARQVGYIRSYGHKTSKLTRAQLKRCNAGVSAQATSTVRSPALSSPKFVTRSEQPLVPPAKVTNPVKTVPPALNSLPMVKHEKGFAAAKVARKPVSALAGLPPRTAAQLGRPKGGLSLTKPPLDNTPSAFGAPPLEGAMNKKLFVPLKKKKSGVARRTGDIQNDKQPRAGDARTMPSRRGGFAPMSPRTAGGAASSSQRTGGFAPAGIGIQAVGGNALSAQQIASINLRKGYWQDYQQAMEAQRRRDAERARERIAQLSREAYLSGADCDDADAEIHPGLLEVCDHKDNNCDGRVDEGTTILSYADLDGDGHGDGASAVAVCPSDITAAQRKGEWLATVGNDCDDSDPDRWRDCATTESGR